MRYLIVKVGQKWATLLITLISIISLVLITIILMATTPQGVMMIGIAISILTPAIVAPILSWYIVGLLIKIHYLEQEQRRLATYDHLTGIMARRAFFEQSHGLLQQCKQNQMFFTLALIDLDNFKFINDTYGHGGGDAVLVVFATLLAKVLPTNDIIGRIGGEEFAVAFWQRSMNKSIPILEQIRVEVENHRVQYLDSSIEYTISIGIAEFDGYGTVDLDELIIWADKALYRAKFLGRNRVEITHSAR